VPLGETYQLGGSLMMPAKACAQWLSSQSHGIRQVFLKCIGRHAPESVGIHTIHEFLNPRTAMRYERLQGLAVIWRRREKQSELKSQSRQPAGARITDGSNSRPQRRNKRCRRYNNASDGVGMCHLRIERNTCPSSLSARHDVFTDHGQRSVKVVFKAGKPSGFPG